MTAAKKPAPKPAPKAKAAPRKPRNSKVKHDKPGMPTTYTPEMGAMICDLLMTPMSLTAVCKLPGTGIPDKANVCRWLVKIESFREMYTAAKAISIDLYVDETIDIADDVSADNAEISRAKLRIDSRWKTAERIAPKKYGQKIDASLVTIPHESWLEQLK